MIRLVSLLVIFCSVFPINDLQGQTLKLGLPIEQNGLIEELAFSVYHQLFATASEDGTVFIWDSKSGNLIHTLSEHNSVVTSVAFGPEGRLLATSSWDGSVIIWDVLTGHSRLKIPGKSGKLMKAVFTPDGQFIAAGAFETGTVHFWNVENGTLLNSINTGRAYSFFDDLTISGDGKRIFISCQDYFAQVWDLEDNSLIIDRQSPREESTIFDFEMKASVLVEASEKGIVRFFDSQRGTLTKIFQCNVNSIGSIDYNSSREQLLTISTEGKVQIWDFNTSSLLWQFNGESYRAKFTKSGDRVLVFSKDNYVKVFDTSAFNQLATFTTRPVEISNIALDSSERNLLIVYQDRKIVNRGIETGTLNYQSRGLVNPFLGAFFDSSKRKCLVVSRESLSGWSIATGEKLFFTPFDLSHEVVNISDDGKLLITADENGSVKIWDTFDGKLLRTFDENDDWVRDVRIGPNAQLAASASAKKVVIWEVESGKQVHSFSSERDDLWSIVFSPDGNYLALFYNSSSELSNVKVLSTLSGNLVYETDIRGEGWSGNISFESRSDLMAIATTSGSEVILKIWSKSQNQIVEEYLLTGGQVTGLTFDSAGDKLLLSTTKGAFIIRLDGDQVDSHVPLDRDSWIQKAIFLEGEKLVSTASFGGETKIWNSANGSFLEKTNGHLSDITELQVSENSKYLLTSSRDGSFVLARYDSTQRQMKHLFFDNNPNKWLHLHPDGFFDASPEAMEMMYWTKGLEVIEFEQLKDRYWIPGLWEKVMKGEPLPKTRGIGQLKLQPEIEVKDVQGGKLDIELTKRDGGFGDVSIFINGKEVAQDARGSSFDTTATTQHVLYDIEDHPFLTAGENTITVKTKSADGFVQGRGTSVVYTKKEENVAPVDFYGIVVGVGDYLNDAINLNFTEKDAESVSKGIRLGASNLFGDERTHIYTLTTSSANIPTKESIQNTFRRVAQEAGPEDVIMLYLSGHGITYGADDINGEFYFLTSEATSAQKNAFRDEYIRNNTAISTAEMIEWIKEIPATKQVMIIDACGSGQAVENLIAARDVEASQLKAIDRMKDRTGMFIISGCAADAVSYEASQYGQGLLTYSILQGMKGAALKEDQYVDVSTILEFARDQVPQLAEGIGGIQTPQLLIPKGGSFDIGILKPEDRELIPLAEPKRVFVRSTLFEEEKKYDVLRLSSALDRELAVFGVEAKGSNLIFFPAIEYPDACQVAGSYTSTAAGIEFDMVLVCGEDITNYQLEAENKDKLIDDILAILKQIE